MRTSISKGCLLAALGVIATVPFPAMSNPVGSNADLSFLVGDWVVERTYNPGSTEAQVLIGSLRCEETLDAAYIRCQYEMQRPGDTPARDDVYFNYNAIYERYESLWLSSTWPIKVLMHGSMQRQQADLILRTTAEFLIAADVTEFVRGELVATDASGQVATFVRSTHIRTSDDAPGSWRHHMDETARRIEER